MTDDTRITSIEELEAHYGQVNPRALDKEQDHLTDHYRAFVEAS
ncbi:MAG TPA: pyridoxamine 5'-phosphate oxidase, partial [Rhodobiaceae bacterium]|nr:pyridoxamine 5'-phosphate oxidase [Rhodobiaceae bacterium]